ncbi:hypothetical protein [Infirmifilum uzonense]|nr:hypothetical protein [Infirmifilum uzonense]
MGEKVKPSTLLIIVTLIPLFLNVAIFIITDGFNVNPTTPPFLYMFGTLAMAVIAVLASIIGFTMARDEEPEWGSKIPFKVIEAMNVFSILLSIVFALLVVLIYFLKGI